MIKEYTLKAFASHRLRSEDKCVALRLTHSCNDMLTNVRAIYELAGR